jgi:hypothetical protein
MVMLLRSTTRRSWPAYATCAFTIAYGALKLWWAVGGTLLMAEAPLPSGPRQRLLAGDAEMVMGHWASVVVSMLGVLIALATVRAWGRLARRWMLLIPASVACVFMVLRAVLQAIGDIQMLADAQATYEIARLARWDLFFWSPYFLVWGVLWGLTAWRYARRRDQALPER